jgi:hypothetical protein
VGHRQRYLTQSGAKASAHWKEEEIMMIPIRIVAFFIGINQN